MLMKSIQMDVSTNFNSSPERTLIVAHAMSSAHARLYSNKYGLEILKEPVFLGGDSRPHYLVYGYLDKILDALSVVH